MKTNQRVRHASVITHEGGPAQREGAVKELRRTLSTCLLFENTFYETGSRIANRLAEQAKNVSVQELIDEIIRAKERMFLRHAPLWMAVHLTSLHRGSFAIGNTIDRVVRRADELAEFLALYWKRNGKDAPITNQTKRGLAKAFLKFDEYQFSKWDRDGEVKLRDVMFLVHPHPATREQEKLFKKIADSTLPPADTWEVRMTAAGNSVEAKREVWTLLLQENKLGALALIRNLRNMEQVGVDRQLVIDALGKAKVSGILPYQFVSAWRQAPAYSTAIDKMAQRAMKEAEPLRGTTALIVDVSGSMKYPLSSKSNTDRMDAAGALAAHFVGVSDDIRVFTFSNFVVEVPAVPGFGIIQALKESQPNSNTYLAKAIEQVSAKVGAVDRIVVITDEQSQDGGLGITKDGRNYIVNVASYEYGVQADRSWVKVHGFSPAVVDWIIQEEKDPLWVGE